MRRLRSDRAHALTGLALALLAAIVTLPASRAFAQGGLRREGALELLLPIGAHTVGAGRAGVSEEPGSEGVWWNPSSVARGTTREIGLHHTQTFINTGDALTLLVPVKKLGVVGGSVVLVNYGQQEETDANGTTGSFGTRALTYIATYASALGDRASFGVNYKVYQLRADCTGGCAGFPPQTASTSALDFGTQLRLDKAHRWQLGVALRNFGFALQVRDQPQADPLPTRIEVGIGGEPAIAALPEGARLRVSASVIDHPSFSSPGYRVGSTIGWQDRARLSVGYALDAPYGSGASLALGFSTGKLSFDIGRLFSSDASGPGQEPTFFSLRYRF
ncbi:MAG: hypothetical protein JWO05_1927 [Gemmatimonadetes bacterium]|nr:hypothetical protein [Gemmatimonadota bacterium]